MTGTPPARRTICATNTDGIPQQGVGHPRLARKEQRATNQTHKLYHEEGNINFNIIIDYSNDEDDDENNKNRNKDKNKDKRGFPRDPIARISLYELLRASSSVERHVPSHASHQLTTTRACRHPLPPHHIQHRTGHRVSAPRALGIQNSRQQAQERHQITHGELLKRGSSAGC